MDWLFRLEGTMSIKCLPFAEGSEWLGTLPNDQLKNALEVFRADGCNLAKSESLLQYWL